MSQLALPLKLIDHAVFESFWSKGNNELLAFLQDLAAGADGPGCWISGATATGKTHLLQAMCARLGGDAIYLPLSEFAATGPDVLEGLASREFVCLDDIDAVAGSTDWELALFTLFNAVTDAAGKLVVSASTSARRCGFELADLQSRFSRLPAFNIRPLAEPDRARALQLRASHRGIELPDETAKYLLSRSRRDMGSLYAALDQLDSEALKAQRRLTIPFVRDALKL